MTRLPFFTLVVAWIALTASAFGQAKVTTCVHVEAAPGDRESLARLVASEVDRHPTHAASTGPCATHLKVELIQLGADRFVTGRMGGEVPERVQVEGPGGKALERALAGLLRVVLGTDPVSLRIPGGRSWALERALSLRDHGRSTLDLAFLEAASPVAGHFTFRPALLAAFSREIASWQVGIEASASQGMTAHPGRADLDTEIRLQAAVTRFFSDTADVAAFAGLSFGVAHQRFSGPRGADVGGGEGVHHATGPLLGLRAGVEFLRTTTLRTFVLADAGLPIFWANDQQAEIVSGWVPTLSMGAGVRF